MLMPSVIKFLNKRLRIEESGRGKRPLKDRTPASMKLAAVTSCENRKNSLPSFFCPLQPLGRRIFNPFSLKSFEKKEYLPMRGREPKKKEALLLLQKMQ